MFVGISVNFKVSVNDHGRTHYLSLMDSPEPLIVDESIKTS